MILLLVVDALDAAGVERAAARQLEQPEALAALDDHVHPAVVELLEQVGDTRTRPDVAQPGLVRIDEPELMPVLEAPADQLLVARLEDVQRHPLGRKQDDAEWEEPDLRHRG